MQHIVQQLGDPTATPPTTNPNFPEPIPVEFPGQVTSGSTHIKFTGITPGTMQHARQRAIGLGGPGAWSAIASLMVI